MAPQKKLCAVDFTFALMLEAGRPACVDVFQALERLKFHFILTDTPLQELQDMAERGSTPDFARFAQLTLTKLASDFGIKTPGLKPVDNACAEHAAAVLSDKVLPTGIMKNAALAIAEASLHGCTCLLTMDERLSAVDANKLNAALIELDLNPISIFNPSVISSFLVDG
ncbi:MAG: hypothetical protein ACXWJB_15160 [Limisphaerales bacterium]